MNNTHGQSRSGLFLQEVTMSLLQRTGQVTETDENLIVLKLPDDVTSSAAVNALGRAAIAAFGIAGIITSIATLVSALLH
jgi:uncharacterized membrane protein